MCTSYLPVPPHSACLPCSVWVETGQTAPRLQTALSINNLSALRFRPQHVKSVLPLTTRSSGVAINQALLALLPEPTTPSGPAHHVRLSVWGGGFARRSSGHTRRRGTQRSTVTSYHVSALHSDSHLFSFSPKPLAVT